MNDEVHVLKHIPKEPFGHRLLLVDDDEFLRSMLVESLTKAGCEVRDSGTVAGAIEILTDFDPNAVLCDLNLGDGPSGIDLLKRIEIDYPWMGQVILSSHRSVELAIGKSLSIPGNAVYLVKSLIRSPTEIIEGIQQAISLRSPHQQNEPNSDDGAISLTNEQAKILRYLAAGYSNSAIAEARGTTLRATEAMVQRTFAALGLEADPNRSQRVLAVNLWMHGKVIVR